MKKVTVPLDSRFYDILIGEDLISNFPTYLEGILSRNFLAIITDKNVERVHLSRLVKALSASGIETKILSIDPGEGSKSWKTLQMMVDKKHPPNFFRRRNLSLFCHRLNYLLALKVKLDTE